MFFSVVIPLYNKAGTVARTLQSVFDQTVQSYEIVVVNDGSDDNGPAIVESLKDPRIRLLHQENSGVSVARNRGVKESKSNLIAFLDADDEWLPSFLENVKKLVEWYPDSGIYATRYYYQDPDGRRRKAVIKGLSEDFEGTLTDYFKVAARSNPPVWTSAACVRKEALKQIGGFPAGVASGEDLLTWAKLAMRFRVSYSMKPLSVYNIDIVAVCRDRPSGPPAQPDVVGQELAKMCEQDKSAMVKSLRHYCAHWHKMRCSSYLRQGMQPYARLEIEMAWRYVFDFSILFYWYMSFLPDKAIRKAFQFVTLFR